MAVKVRALYYSPRYRDGFVLECRAIRRIREKMGFENVAQMILLSLPARGRIGAGRNG